MIDIQILPVYHGASQRIDVTLRLEGMIKTQYELSEFLKHIEALKSLIPSSTDPDE